MDSSALALGVRKLYRRFGNLMITASVCGGIFMLSFALAVASGPRGTIQIPEGFTLILGITFLLSAAIGIVAYLTAMVFSWILLYRAWQSVQEAKPWTTPGKAVGFCFIPIFQHYWAFVAFYGLARIMSRLKRQIGLPASKGLEILTLVLCLFPIVGLIVWAALAQTMERNDAALFAVPTILFLFPTIIHWIIITRFARTTVSMIESSQKTRSQGKT